MNSVTGVVKDISGETLPQANVYFSDRNGKILPLHQGTASNNQGQFQLEGEGAYITASYVGYNKQTKPIKRNLEFILESPIELQEVEVIAEKPKSTVIVKNYNSLIIAGIVVSFISIIGYLFIIKK